MREYPPLRASITGIDGAGKSTVSEIITSQLPWDIPVAKISRPVYTVIEGHKQPRYAALMKVVDVLHGFADRQQSRRLSLVANAVDVFLQGRVIEPGLIRKIHPRLVLGTRDYLIDPAVYAIFYSPKLARLPMERRINFFHTVSGSDIRSIIFFLTVPPDMAIARIENRIAEEAKGRKESSRMKWRHMHEQLNHLDLLQQEYYAALSVIRRKGNPEIHEIDTSHLSQQEVADFITSSLQERLSQDRGVF